MDFHRITHPTLRGCRLAAITLAGAAVTGATAQAAVPSVDAHGQGAVIRCGATAAGNIVRASHADKIVFRLTGFLLAEQDADQAALNLIPRNTELDIKVLDDARTVADLRGKVLTFLGARDLPDNRQNVVIQQVLYAMVCPTTAAP